LIRSYISPEEMEIVTQQILVDYGINLDNPQSCFPIPIEEIIEFHYELSIDWEDIDHYSPDETVMAAIIPSERKIIMNESQKEFFEEKIGTMHFTFAHELGHWVLHAIDESQLCLDLFSNKKIFYCRSKSIKPPVEYQADLFAACILMPKPVIIETINSMKENGKIEWRDLYALRDKLCVSISALKYRLEQLNLLHIKDKIIYSSKEEALGQIEFQF
jgi:Zn-dependent peptidase ImmA (M78 family)